MTPEEQEQEEEKKKKPSILAPSLMVGAGALGVIGGLNLAGSAAEPFSEFRNLATGWTKNRPDAENSLYEYVNKGSEVTNKFRMFGFGPGLKSVLRVGRSMPFLPDSMKWKPDSGNHYEMFERGPMSGYMQYLKENLDAGHMPSGGTKRFLLWGDTKNDSIMNGVKDNANALYKQLYGKDNVNLASFDEQKSVFGGLNDYIQKTNPSFFKQKLNLDKSIGAGSIPLSGGLYAKNVGGTYDALKAGLVIGGGALGAYGAYKLIRNIIDRNKKKKEEEQIQKGASTDADDLVKGHPPDTIPDNIVPKKVLEEGMEDEKEHTNNKEVAKLIAKDHLVKNPEYYKLLEQYKIGSDICEDTFSKIAKLSPTFKLIYYENRSTPQVVKAGEEAKSKTGYGEVTGKRDATAKEVATIMKGRWLRKDEQDNDPKSKDYKKTKMRPHLLKKGEEEMVKELIKSPENRTSALWAHVTQDPKMRQEDLQSKISDLQLNPSPKEAADVWMSAHWLGLADPTQSATVDSAKKMAIAVGGKDVVTPRLDSLEKRLADTGTLWKS